MTGVLALAAGAVLLHPWAAPGAHASGAASAGVPGPAAQVVEEPEVLDAASVPGLETGQTSSADAGDHRTVGTAGGAPGGGAVDCAVARCVALTFDDGPGPYTDTLLDELSAQDVPATFFLIGRQAQSRPGTVARELAEGHVVGNHTWSHPDLRRLGSDEIADELGRTAQAVADAAGATPTLVRPPYGAVDDHVLQVLAARGEAAVLWDVDTEDWKNEDVAETTRRAVEGAHPGAIVLMHDVHPTTVQALPGIVDQLRAAGYTLVTVPELLGDRLQPGARLFGR